LEFGYSIAFQVFKPEAFTEAISEYQVTINSIIFELEKATSEDYLELFTEATLEAYFRCNVGSIKFQSCACSAFLE
jgi:hypothetical protein